MGDETNPPTVYHETVATSLLPRLNPRREVRPHDQVEFSRSARGLGSVRHFGLRCDLWRLNALVVNRSC